MSTIISGVLPTLTAFISIIGIILPRPITADTTDQIISDFNRSKEYTKLTCNDHFTLSLEENEMSFFELTISSYIRSNYLLELTTCCDTVGYHYDTNYIGTESEYCDSLEDMNTVLALFQLVQYNQTSNNSSDLSSISVMETSKESLETDCGAFRIV